MVMTQATEQRILCPNCRASNRADARFCQQCGSDMLLDNLYRITRVIKEGGMGVVYKAIDAVGVEYAVKEMRDNFATSAEREDGIKRFVDEAELLSRMNHPAIPTVYRSFIDEGRYYLSMEFIHGEDLEDMLEREKRFPEETVLRWAEQLCDVLEYMHDNGLIYRDMKPSNVMIDRDGNIKLVDFGIAKLLQPGQRQTMVGTPGYAPPEQYQGLATVQSDIYALGATLHHLLTGRDPREHPPFSFPFATDLRPEISEQTARAIDKALQMEVADRYRSVDAFRRALPLPTGDRRPTLPFDLTGREGRSPEQKPATPRPPPQRQPVVPARQPQARSLGQQSRPSRTRIAPAPAKPRKRGGVGRTIRRAVVTAMLAAGIGASVVYGPEALPVLRNLITQVQPAPNPGTVQNPTNIYVATKFDTTVYVDLPETASDQEIIDGLDEAYLKQAQLKYPGSRINTQPAIVGDWTAGDVVNGQRTYSADLSAYIDVPQSP